MKRLQSFIAALTLLFAVSWPAVADNVLRWASVGGALTFDPHGYDDTATGAQIRSVYERLVELDSNLAVVPGLAVAWRLINPTTWEFQLRPNVRFHDGTEFTAADVTFSIARAKASSEFAYYVDSIDAMQILDEHAVRLKTAVPDFLLPIKLFSVEIMSKRWAKAHGVQVAAKVAAGEKNYASRHANGTGPFILQEFEPNGRAVMVRNPKWWGLERYPHNIDRVEYTPIPDPMRRLDALLRGDLDLLIDPPLMGLDRIESTPGLKLARTTEPRVIYLGLDQTSAALRSSNIKGRNPFKDRRVRQAIYHAIDIEAIRQGVMRGFSIPAGMMVAPGVNGYASQLDQRLPHDLDVAKALLAWGWISKWLQRHPRLPEQPLHQRPVRRAVAMQLGAIGIKVDANARPKDVIFAKVDNRESDFHLIGLAAGTLDSYDVFFNLYRTGAKL